MPFFSAGIEDNRIHWYSNALFQSIPAAIPFWLKILLSPVLCFSWYTVQCRSWTCSYFTAVSYGEWFALYKTCSCILVILLVFRMAELYQLQWLQQVFASVGFLTVVCLLSSCLPLEGFHLQWQLLSRGRHSFPLVVILTEYKQSTVINTYIVWMGMACLKLHFLFDCKVTISSVSYTHLTLPTKRIV